MTRAQYLQARGDMQLVATLVKEMPLDAFLATIDEAVKEGPARSPKMWAEGHEGLVAARKLASALAEFRRGL